MADREAEWPNPPWELLGCPWDDKEAEIRFLERQLLELRLERGKRYKDEAEEESSSLFEPEHEKPPSPPLQLSTIPFPRSYFRRPISWKREESSYTSVPSSSSFPESRQEIQNTDFSIPSLSEASRSPPIPESTKLSFLHKHTAKTSARKKGTSYPPLPFPPSITEHRQESIKTDFSFSRPSEEESSWQQPQQKDKEQPLPRLSSIPFLRKYSPRPSTWKSGASAFTSVQYPPSIPETSEGIQAPDLYVRSPSEPSGPGLPSAGTKSVSQLISTDISSTLTEQITTDSSSIAADSSSTSTQQEAIESSSASTMDSTAGSTTSVGKKKDKREKDKEKKEKEKERREKEREKRDKEKKDRDEKDKEKKEKREKEKREKELEKEKEREERKERKEKERQEREEEKERDTEGERRISTVVVQTSEPEEFGTPDNSMAHHFILRLFHTFTHLIFVALLLLTIGSLALGTFTLFFSSAQDVLTHLLKGVTQASLKEFVLALVGFVVFLLLLGLTLLCAVLLIPALWVSIVEVILSPWSILSDYFLP